VHAGQRARRTVVLDALGGALGFFCGFTLELGGPTFCNDGFVCCGLVLELLERLQSRLLRKCGAFLKPRIFI
jgi:hypothetical protein